MKHKIDEVALNNLNLALQFIVEDGYSSIINDVEIQLDKNLELRLRKLETEPTSRLSRILQKFEDDSDKDKTKLPETIAALKKLLATDYFEKLAKELECDKIGLVIDPASDSINISLGHQRNRYIQKFLFWVRRRFTVGILFDEVYYRWTYYGDFSSARGIELAEQLKEKNDALYKAAKENSKTADEILNETLKGK